MTPLANHDPLRLIIAYKTVKGAAQLGLALALAVAAMAGMASELGGLVHAILHHVTQAWATHFAAWCMQAATKRHLLIISIALGLDGSLTSLEGWALRRRVWWGPWLVVVASGALLPYEVFELVRHPHISRAVLAVANAAIVAYLARRALRERRRERRAVEAATATDATDRAPHSVA